MYVQYTHMMAYEYIIFYIRLTFLSKNTEIQVIRNLKKFQSHFRDSRESDQSRLNTFRNYTWKYT